VENCMIANMLHSFYPAIDGLSTSGDQ